MIRLWHSIDQIEWNSPSPVHTHSRSGTKQLNAFDTGRWTSYNETKKFSALESSHLPHNWPFFEAFNRNDSQCAWCFNWNFKHVSSDCVVFLHLSFYFHSMVVAFVAHISIDMDANMCQCYNRLTKFCLFCWV